MKYEIEEKNSLDVYAIHTDDRKNKKLVKLLSNIKGVKTAYAFLDYEIEINVAKMFNDEDVLREVKSKIHMLINHLPKE